MLLMEMGIVMERGIGVGMGIPRWSACTSMFVYGMFLVCMYSMGLGVSVHREKS